MERGGWTTVSARRGKSARAAPPPPARAAAQPMIATAAAVAAAVVDAAAAQRLQRQFDAKLSTMRASAFSRTFVDLVDANVRVVCAESACAEVDIVCLGLGSPECSAAAQYQLAFLALVLERWRGGREARSGGSSGGGDGQEDGVVNDGGDNNGDASSAAEAPVAHVGDVRVRVARAYDPVFTAHDVALLARLGVALDAYNREGCCALDDDDGNTAPRPTLFYMPHCGNAMYHNVVAANWRADALCRVVIVGNSFATYARKLPFRPLHAPQHCTRADLERREFGFLRLAAALVEAPVDDDGSCGAVAAAGAFNDTAVHRFDAAALRRCYDDAHWRDAPLPYAAADGEVSEIVEARVTHAAV